MRIRPGMRAALLLGLLLCGGVPGASAAPPAQGQGEGRVRAEVLVVRLLPGEWTLPWAATAPVPAARAPWAAKRLPDGRLWLRVPERGAALCAWAGSGTLRVCFVPERERFSRTLYVVVTSAVLLRPTQRQVELVYK